MLIFFLFLSAVLITLFAEWIIKPELIMTLYDPEKIRNSEV